MVPLYRSSLSCSAKSSKKSFRASKIKKRSDEEDSNAGSSVHVNVKRRIAVPEGNESWGYLLPKEYWHLGKVQGRTDGWIFHTLKNRFNETQKQIFLDSCFGHLLGSNYIGLNLQLLHQVLIREVKQDERGEMWFDFNGKRAKFSIHEFCLITGLRCTGDSNRKKFARGFNRLKNHIFKNYKTVNIPALLEVFNGNTSISDKDFVSLGILCMLTLHMYTVKYPKAIEASLMSLVDSPVRDSYAWGAELFKYTIKHLKGGLRNKTMSQEGNGRPSIGYRVNGYLIAFQVWIYETLPDLRGLVCNKIGDGYPRILNWTSVVSCLDKKVNVATDIFNRSDLQVLKIEPSAKEMAQPYTIGLFDDCNREQVPGTDCGDPFPVEVQENLKRLPAKTSVPSTSNDGLHNDQIVDKRFQGADSPKSLDAHQRVVSVLRESQRCDQSTLNVGNVDSPVFGLQTESRAHDTTHVKSTRKENDLTFSITDHSSRSDQFSKTYAVRKLDFSDDEVAKVIDVFVHTGWRLANELNVQICSSNDKDKPVINDEENVLVGFEMDRVNQVLNDEFLIANTCGEMVHLVCE